MDGIELQPPQTGKYIRFVIYFLVLVFGLFAIYYIPNREEINRNWKIRSEAKKTEKCLSQGGKMISVGCGIANCVYECVIPYGDGGRKCTSSSQCSGRCVVAKGALPDVWEFSHIKNQNREISGCQQSGKYAYNCPGLNLVGNCEEIEMANCESLWELNNKEVTGVFADCKL